MHIHILGICGTFMGGLAVLAREAGHTVTGCDAGVYPPMSTQLEAQGIALIEGYGAEQIDALTPDLFVIGNVVTRGNPLMEAILDRGLPYVSGPQWLGEHVLAGKWVLAVAGTHGKTTTSSMLAWLLEDAGLDPGFLIGGVPLNFGISARLTDSSFFVIEADEYDTAFFDKRSKFVHYRPRTAILNNLEYDHADIFPDLAAIETQFHHLVRTVPRVGRLVVNGREAALERVLARGVWSEVERFGVDGGWLAAPVAEGQAVDEQFALYWQGERVGAVDWQVQGEHNRLNALAAIAAARHVGVPAAQAARSLTSFRNVKRRMEVRGSVDGVTVYDDFAHHPTAIETTIAGLRTRIGEHARIVAVLEPRSNTMKLGVMKAQLPASLADADLVFGYGAPSGRDALGWNLGEALAPLGAKARAFDDLGALVASVVAAARAGDHLLVMSNGGFGGVHQKLLDALAARSGAGAVPDAAATGSADAGAACAAPGERGVA
ncbi:UDP-N-acetylmuramate: L-alanyl-gamma-D-glutamyl-meso-diaminopimelate ligase [Trinickia symbiotica]|uniref:UDP-N-acetylmuramate--L-alanyl-gamma-D-glutamyl-meso-2,6-diaminoheptandioate ligase n=1 Tax=Trinickia symbiotica TaxID=863227 RepID=A0A2N7WYL1_9BURK|nr:UDP-N-acetylmuramate:L-alanyl-gamma-D-glutamyl-meso-diaminopimelate ligase [Trinickia symbiotica]PPK43083.1 UDP-N-acetylmuramate: L-alanyl-gamma-D-glutamyl-meso-diaminopimelate ligase [Trinickia symbiotica]